METRQRAFAQKLKWQHNADIRQQISSLSTQASKQDNSSKHNILLGKIPINDVVEPLDFEEFLDQHREQIECDPFRHMLDFPEDDIEIGVLPHKCRTTEHILPDDETIKSQQCFTPDWIVINRRYQQYSSSYCLCERSLERQNAAKSIPKQEFEIDLAAPASDLKDDESRLKQISELPLQHPPLAEDEDTTSDSSAPSSNRQSFQLADTPRGSWASSVFDLRNSQADPLIPSLLDHTPSEALDYVNEIKRQENRTDSVFALYPPMDEEEFIEKRLPGPIPSEHIGHKLIVKCLALKLDLEIEPIFGTMALYDAKEKRKVSENFYFDMNSEPLKRMLSSHVCYQDISTLSRSCIFQITNPSPDLFLVIKLEKVLQGDISECIEPYVKDDKNRDKLKSNAVLTCERLGKYRMPFAWTAIYLMNIINGVNNMDKDAGSDRDSISSSNSLDRKSGITGLETLRKKSSDSGTLSNRGTLERRNTIDKRSSWCSDELGANLDSFRPVTLTVNSFFKQETDRLRDDDLFKFLLDLKRPSSVLKRLKCIPGILKLDIAPCPDEPKYCLTPELARLHPYPDEKGRPTKEILELPVKEIYVPHYSYRNLLFVYPRDVNFTNRPGSARNITCKVQYMASEEIHSALPIIFGKSSCPEFLTEVYTTITYHNRFPDFYDEVKIKLPSIFTEQHHLLFTFYHISCQKKVEQNPTETPIGYTWFPLFRDGRLQTGDFNLPIMMENPPPSYSFLTPFIQIPNTKWVDNHKGVFNITLHAVSSIFPKDSSVDRFLNLCRMLEEGTVPARMGENSLETELKNSMLEITNAPDFTLESLVNFLPPILNKLIYLLVRPPVVAGQAMNIGQTAFESIAMVVNTVTSGLENQNDRHNRSSLLVTYLSYQCIVPHNAASMYGSSTNESNPLGLGFGTLGRHFSTPLHRSCYGRSNSNPDIVSYVDADGEVSSILSRGLDRTASMRAAAVIQDNVLCAISMTQARKVLHEEIALQCVVSSGSTRELVLTNSWFFFDLIIRSMTEHLATTNRLDIPRKMRFCAQFFDDITTLITTVTSDIIGRCTKEGEEKFTRNLNSSLAFFLCDLLSVVDRGYVFCLIKAYCKQMSAKISTLPDSAFLMSLKLDFLRIICAHEHFVALNLPFGTPISPSPATSPCPSVASSSSQCSILSTGTLVEKGNFTELSVEFRQQHFLVGLVLSDLWTALSMNNSMLQTKAINLVRNLLTSHDCDDRLLENDQKARVASLYLPLLGIVLDALPLLYDWQSSTMGHENDGDNDGMLSEEVASAISSSSIPTKHSLQCYDVFPSRKIQLKEDSTRHLLTCVLWVLKNVDKKVLRNWWADLQPRRLHQLLEIMYISISCFEYKGKKILMRCSQQHMQKTSDIKSRLEDAILGHTSARSEMMRRKDRNPPSPSPQSGDKLRWRKDQMIWRSNSDVVERPKFEVESAAHIESNLAAEVNMIVLDILELIVQVACHCDALQGVLSTVLKVLLHALGSNQSTVVLQNMFATQRSLVYKFPELLFEEETEQCADLCLRLLRHCSSSISCIRSQASASLYLLMRQNFEIGNNFARVKMQVTMSLSSLVGTNRNFNEEYLRHSLKTILVYAEEDSELQVTTFPEQVHDLVFNLHMILSDTVKMKEFQEDPEMLMDLMFRIAKGYQTSPDLRLTWLANMAQKHTERSNHVEAAHCHVHSAALVAEYLYMLEDRPYLPVGCVTFEKISPNVLEESAVSDDVVSPDEEGICTGKYFTENGLIGLLEQAANSFSLGGMYENVNEVYKILIPIAEAHRDYKTLALIHSKLHDSFVKIDQHVGKRVFGTYFRVGFYGSKFGDLDSEEFIYKEPYLTKLPEISHRLENFYAERFGTEFVEVIKDSNTVDPMKLNPEKAYIQITYVEPFFEMFQLRERVTHFDRNYNIRCFIYATPFTPDGRAHGELHEQYKRKTILTTTCSFPYVKTRIQVVERHQIVLTPIEVAIEDVMKKTQELDIANHQDPADPKILQMVLQGCIGTTVNQGPMEVAHVFLTDLMDGKTSPTPLQHKLRLCFKDFLLKCNEALRKNRTLIGPEQKDYQKELERNYHRFMERLLPMIKLSSASVSKLSRDRHGSGDRVSKRKQ